MADALMGLEPVGLGTDGKWHVCTSTSRGEAVFACSASWERCRAFQWTAPWATPDTPRQPVTCEECKRLLEEQSDPCATSSG